MASKRSNRQNHKIGVKFDDRLPSFNVLKAETEIIKVGHNEASRTHFNYLVDEIDEGRTRRPTCIEDKLGDL